MVLTDDELTQAEERVLSILKDSPSPYPPLQLIDRLKELHISEFLARAAIWYLIDRDEIELTRDRLLKPATTNENERTPHLASSR